MAIRTDEIQAALRAEELDGWLLYDFHGLNPIARRIAGLHGFVTRRWFLLIPATGEPEVICHLMEEIGFAGVPGRHHHYRTWQELDALLKQILSGRKRVAMEYSPGNAIPYVARVDAGTVEKVRALGTEVVSSADLVAQFSARWSPKQIALHRRAAAGLLEIKDRAFALIGDHVRGRKTLTEYAVAAFVRKEFARLGLICDDGPICAVDANAGNPHYEPDSQSSARIDAGQLILLDLWAKCDEPEAAYADITWTGFTGPTVPSTIASVFAPVAAARDGAVAFVNERLRAGQLVHGYEVDAAAREVIVKSGYGDRFLHRTGHSIGTQVHDVGPNIDGLETQDRRRLQEGMAFTIEPGIYLAEFGIRSEINVLIQNGKAEITTLPLQTEVTPIV
ncbi:MAG: aminopeptidase P family protein [candidate division Zixibacteria bacterium]|nr:aminopeptidase P family protein [candidate division Zixibacteria bacterium]